jgi:hypothetical protein
VVTVGSISPAPAPWMTRNRIRLPMFQAAPDRTDPVRNSIRENSHIRRPPKRSDSQPVTGMAIPIASR